MADLDSILSGAGAAASEAPETVTTEAAPAVTETQEQTSEQTGTEGEGGTKMVPHEALHAEKQKVKRYTEQVASFEKTMADQAAAVRRLEQQLLSAVTAKPQTPVEEPKALDPWDEGYTDSIQQKFQTELAETRFVLSRNVAIATQGEETVDAADEALKQAVASGQMNGAEVRARLMKSRDPVGDVVRWYKNSPAMREQELREKIRAELLAEIQPQGGTQQQAPQGQQAAVVMPSDLAGARNVGSRSGPAWSGPQSINDIFDRARKPKTA